jgi:hypothetical protein
MERMNMESRTRTNTSGLQGSAARGQSAKKARFQFLASALLLALAAASFPVAAGATVPVTFQASANGSFSAASGTVTLNLASVTTSNNMLLVGISVGANATPTSIKWGGSSGTALAVVPSCTGTGSSLNNAHFEIWSLANPNLTASPDTVVITFSGSQTFYAGAALFAHVLSLGTCLTSSGGTGSTTKSLSPTVLTGGAAFDTVAVNTISSATITVGSGQTTVYNLSSSESAGAASYKLAPVASMTESWNTSTSVWAYGAVPLNPLSSRSSQVIIGRAQPSNPQLVTRALVAAARRDVCPDVTYNLASNHNVRRSQPEARAGLWGSSLSTEPRMAIFDDSPAAACG